MEIALQNKSLNRVFFALFIAALAWVLLISSFGYAEIRLEYKGQPVTFGRHYICYNRISYNMAFLVPYNFRITVGRSGNLASTILPDGKQLIARLPQSCGWNNDMSTTEGTSALPALILADNPTKPEALTFFVSTPELMRGIDDIKFISMKTRFTPYPTGFSWSDESQAPWYVVFGKYNMRREFFYYGSICTETQLKDIPEQRRGEPFFVKSRTYLQSLTKATILDDDAASQANFSLSLLSDGEFELLRYGLSPPETSNEQLQHFNPDMPTTSSPFISAELRDGIRYLRPDQTGIVRLYGEPLKTDYWAPYTIDMYGEKTTTRYKTTGFYHPETESLLLCEKISL